MKLESKLHSNVKLFVEGTIFTFIVLAKSNVVILRNIAVLKVGVIDLPTLTPTKMVCRKQIC